MPTILDACGVALPQLPDGRKIDGLPLLKPARERSLFFQWHRGDEPQPFRECAVLDGSLEADRDGQADTGAIRPAGRSGGEPDLAGQEPEVAARLRRSYDEWFADVARDHGYAPPRIALGSRDENPVLLTRQDWRGPAASWDADGLGSLRGGCADSGPLSGDPAVSGAGGGGYRRGGIRRGNMERRVLGRGVRSRYSRMCRCPPGLGGSRGGCAAAERTFGAHYVQVMSR